MGYLIESLEMIGVEVVRVVNLRDRGVRDPMVSLEDGQPVTVEGKAALQRVFHQGNDR